MSTTCATLVAGCRELEFNYAAATTATGNAEAEWGDYAGQLQSVTFTAFDAAGVKRTPVVAQYLYDASGHLRTVWDPRISPALKTKYDYDAAGHVTVVTPPGELPRTITYAALPGESNTGRLQNVSRPALPSGTAVILFADIADSTALTERLGDAAFREKARDLDAALRTAIREHVGTPIEGKLLGDGVLAVFTSARQAIEAALACGHSGDEAGLPLHLGLHAGDVIREENNVYGGAVNIASRISGLSAPGEVLVSETVRSLARTSGDVSFEDRGEQPLKGVGERVRVWAVVRGEAS